MGTSQVVTETVPSDHGRFKVAYRVAVVAFPVPPPGPQDRAKVALTAMQSGVGAVNSTPSTPGRMGNVGGVEFTGPSSVFGGFLGGFSAHL